MIAMLSTTHSHDIESLSPDPLPVPFKDTSTPCILGAIRPGGRLHLFRRDSIGLLLDWFLVGIFNATMAILLDTILNSFWGFTDFQVNAADCLNRLPWLFKFLGGFLSDCFPIQRRLRKPYVILGWTVFAVIMFVIASVDLPKPHVYVDGEQPDTRGEGIVIAMMLGYLVHVLAIVALEGMMFECGQREGKFVRGQTQCLCIIFRYRGEFVCGLSLILAFNSAAFGGTFAASVPICMVFVFLGLLAIAGVVVTILWLREDKMIKTTQRLTTQLRLIWGMMQQQATWQITVLGCLLILGTTYDVQEINSIQTDWLGTTALEENISTSALSLGDAAAASVYMTLLCNTNWRTTMVTCVLVSLLVSLPVDMIVTFDVWRNQVFYYSKLHVAYLLDASLSTLRAIMIVEVVQLGYEAVGYGLITTAFNLSITVMTNTQNILAANFDQTVTDIASDTSTVRRHVANEFIAKYVLMKVMILIVYRLIPCQRCHLRAIRQRSSESMLIPMVLSWTFTILFGISFVSKRCWH